MRSEDLAVFLKRLSPDAAEAERRYMYLRNNKLVGFFNMRGVSDPEGAAAETLDRAAEKIGGGADVPNVENYCIGIARNVAREHWRHERREDAVFRLFIDSLADDSAEEVKRIEHVLKPCFRSLKDKDRKLLVAYCLTPEELPRAEAVPAVAAAAPAPAPLQSENREIKSAPMPMPDSAANILRRPTAEIINSDDARALIADVARDAIPAELCPVSSGIVTRRRAWHSPPTPAFV
jgi:DNA-directed RNA polymerase specialized sigma24 family protein